MATQPTAKNLGVNNQLESPAYALFPGGLNVKDFWHLLLDTELTVAQNIRLDEAGGAIRMRGSWSNLTPGNPVGTAGPLVGLYHPSRLVAGALTRYVVVTDGATVWWLNGAVWTNITGSVSLVPVASTLVLFQTMANLLIGYDGLNAPWTWDGQAAAILLLPGAPPIGNIGLLFQNYWFVAGVAGARSRLYFSDLGDPTTWPAINFIDVPSPYDGDPIMGLAVLYGNMVIFKRHSIYIMTGTDPTTFSLSATNAAVGCVSPYSVVSIENLVYFVSDKGLYAINLSNEKQICYKVQPRYDSAVTNQLSGALAKNQIQALNYRLRNEVWELADCTAAGQQQHDRTLTHNYVTVDANGDPAVAEHTNYGSITITAGVNDTIDFEENGGAQLTATLTPGTYPVGANSGEAGTLCNLIKVQMNAVGLFLYTVTWSAATDELTITKNSGVFVIKFASGTHTAKNASGAMGFSPVDTASAISATGTVGVRAGALAALCLACTAPSVLADYYSGSILPMASFYDKYVYIFNGSATADDQSAGSAKPIQLAFTTGYKSLGDATLVKTLRNIWTNLQQSGGTPKVSIGVLGNNFGTETVGTLTPANAATFYNVKQPAGQVFGSSPQGKFFKFGFISNDGGAFTFFQVVFDYIWNGRRN